MSISLISHIALLLALMRHTAAAPVADSQLEARQYPGEPKDFGPPPAVIVPIIIVAVVIGIGVIGTLIWKFWACGVAADVANRHTGVHATRVHNQSYNAYQTYNANYPQYGAYNPSNAYGANDTYGGPPAYVQEPPAAHRSHESHCHHHSSAMNMGHHDAHSAHHTAHSHATHH